MESVLLHVTGQNLDGRCSDAEETPRVANGDLDMAFENLSVDVRELSLGTGGEVDRVRGPLSPVEFLRNYVSPGRPCIITDALDHWPALHKWSNDYLCSMLRDQSVSVHFTPDGRADALVDPVLMLSKYRCPVISPSSSAVSPSSLSSLEPSPLVNQTPASKIERNRQLQDLPDLLFVKAHVEKLLFSEALQLIVACSGCGGESVAGVAYAQEQNGCFLSEFGALTEDAEVHIPWATEALGCMPDAVNLWIGNEHATTSFHKDHYENLYAVVAGAKHFTLLPPVDVHRMYINSYPSAQYVRNKGSNDFSIVVDQPAATVPWVTVDPYPADVKLSKARFPRYFNGCQPFTCTVQAGEILYLPAMWFHHVRQSPDLEGRTIALNFWYDMQFDIKFAYFNMMESLLRVPT